MFRAKTVFVLGAGASAEVGLPVGETLKGIIAKKIDIQFKFGNEQISGDHQITSALREQVRQPDGRGGDIYPYLHAAWRLRDALPHAISIDHALDAHRDDELAKVCGKLAIVRSILEAEQNSKIGYSRNERRQLNFDQVADTWFVKFVHLLTESVPKNEINKIFDNVTFVSFNYDRCIEHYLHEALQKYYALDEKAATEIMKPLKIFHPYGSVGKLPWQDPDHTLQVPYGAERYNLLELSKQIKTFHETVDEKAEIDNIAREIHKAKIIVFLGFAFHEQNLKLIDPKMNSHPKRVYATVWEVSDSNRTVIMSAIGDLLKSNQGVTPGAFEFAVGLKCARLLHNFSRILTSP